MAEPTIGMRARSSGNPEPQGNPEEQAAGMFERRVEHQLTRDLSRYGAEPLTNEQRQKFWAGEELTVQGQQGNITFQKVEPRDGQGGFNFRAEPNRWTAPRRIPLDKKPVDYSNVSRSPEQQPPSADTDPAVEKSGQAPLPTPAEQAIFKTIAGQHVKNTGGSPDDFLAYNQANGRYWMVSVGEDGEIKAALTRAEDHPNITPVTFNRPYDGPEVNQDQGQSQSQSRQGLADETTNQQKAYPTDGPSTIEQSMILSTVGKRGESEFLFNNGDYHWHVTKNADGTLGVNPVSNPQDFPNAFKIAIHESDVKGWSAYYEKNSSQNVAEEHAAKAEARGQASVDGPPSSPPTTHNAQAQSFADANPGTRPVIQDESPAQTFPLEEPPPIKIQELSGSESLVGRVNTSSERMAIEGSSSSVESYSAELQAVQTALAGLDDKYRQMMTYTNKNGEDVYADGMEGARTRTAIKSFAEENGLDPEKTTIKDFLKHIQEKTPATAVTADNTQKSPAGFVAAEAKTPEGGEGAQAVNDPQYEKKIQPDAYEEARMNAAAQEPEMLEFLVKAFKEAANPAANDPSMDQNAQAAPVDTQDQTINNINKTHLGFGA